MALENNDENNDNGYDDGDEEWPTMGERERG